MNFAKEVIQRGYTNKILCGDLAARSMTVACLDPQVRGYFLGWRSGAIGVSKIAV